MYRIHLIKLVEQIRMQNALNKITRTIHKTNVFTYILKISSYIKTLYNYFSDVWQDYLKGYLP